MAAKTLEKTDEPFEEIVVRHGYDGPVHSSPEWRNGGIAQVTKHRSKLPL